VIGDLRNLLFYLIVVLVDLLLEVMLQLSFALQGNFLSQESFIAANGNRVACSYFCELAVEIGGREVGIEAFLVDKLPVPIIFGALDMEAYRIKLDLAREALDLSEFTGYMLAV
jgi:hypothetical protein